MNFTGSQVAERCQFKGTKVIARAVRFTAGCAIGSLVIGGSPALAATGIVAAPFVSTPLIKADARRGGLRADERAGLIASDVASTSNPRFSPPPDDLERSSATASIPSGMPVLGLALSSRYGWRVHPVLGVSGLHKGVDMAGPAGAPVYATADGMVEKAEWFGSYGLYVGIDHGANFETRYGHMSRLAVAGGQRVRKGDVIGYVGSTGRSTGPHLHYEVRMAGEPVDPAPFMAR